MHDVAIVGAGPVGTTLALALRDADLDVVVVDGRAAGATPRADRSLALSHGARLIFERLGVWTALAAAPGAVTPIVAIDVSQARGFGALRLEAADVGLPALGYVVSNRALQSVLDQSLREARVDVRFGASARAITTTADAAHVDVAGYEHPIASRLIVVADGASLSVPGISRHRHDYGQCAIVATLELDYPHGGVAFERFTSNGPVALLPERDNYALVWTQTPFEAAQTLQLTESAFLDALGRHFGSRAGGFAHVGERRSFPLILEVARNTTAQRVAVIGNAAQSLHPIAGQGFNLGLRDAYELAAIIIDTPRAALGDGPMLDRYRHDRGVDRRAGIAFTHGLVRLFGSDRTWLRVPRGLGMALLDSMPFAKRAFTRTMLFGVR